MNVLKNNLGKKRTNDIMKYQLETTRNKKPLQDVILMFYAKLNLEINISDSSDFKGIYPGAVIMCVVPGRLLLII